MMTHADNERLTRVGPGTPMGDLLRRYWHAVAALPDLDDNPVRRIRVLGENLTLFRAPDGGLGLVGERCPHRGVDLVYAIPEAGGLRCPYHGWLFDTGGRCLEMPYDDRQQSGDSLSAAGRPAGHHARVAIDAYPVQALGGLIYAYLGPAPVPLLPKWDLLVRPELERAIEIHELPCNWLQCMDNSADPVHFEFLHARLGNYTLQRQGKPPKMTPKRHLKIGFERFKWGFMKRRLLEGEPETGDDWTVGHPVLFPNVLAQGPIDAPTLQIRTPIDDTHTLHFGYRTRTPAAGQAPGPLRVVRESIFDAGGRLVPDRVQFQDFLAWVAQGPVSDRTREHLAASDAGVVLYRRMLVEALDAIARGEDPLGVIRDESETEPMIVLPREAETLKPYESKYEGLHERIEGIKAAE